MLKVGLAIHSLELYPEYGAQMLRSAGVTGFVVYKGTRYVIVKLRSGFLVKLSKNCMATIGSVNNRKHRFMVKGYAGVNRCLG